jgi:hypothetical protein
MAIKVYPQLDFFSVNSYTDMHGNECFFADLLMIGLSQTTYRWSLNALKSSVLPVRGGM